jgi:hypothetical protein
MKDGDFPVRPVNSGDASEETSLLDAQAERGGGGEVNQSSPGNKSVIPGKGDGKASKVPHSEAVDNSAHSESVDNSADKLTEDTTESHTVLADAVGEPKKLHRDSEGE